VKANLFFAIRNLRKTLAATLGGKKSGEEV